MVSVHHLEDVASLVVAPEYLVGTIHLKTGGPPKQTEPSDDFSIFAVPIAETPVEPTLAALWKIIQDAPVLEISAYKTHLNSNGVSLDEISLAEQKYNQIKGTAPWTNLTEQEIISITIYTGNSIYSPMNKAFREFTPTNTQPVEKWATIARAISTGLEKLPSYSGTPIFRGFNKPPTGFEVYQPGNTVEWLALASSSTNIDVADNFGNVIITIAHKNGKDIKAASFYAEGEILLPLLTLISVSQVYVSGSNTHVICTEVDVPTVTPNPNPTAKTLLWVDDVPSNNSYYVQEATAKGITVVPVLSTADALSYVQTHSYLLTLGLEKFRIVTDGGRYELTAAGGTVFAPTAYKTLVEALRSSYKYPQTVGVFTSSVSRIPTEDVQSLNLVVYADGSVVNWVYF